MAEPAARPHEFVLAFLGALVTIVLWVFASYCAMIGWIAASDEFMGSAVETQPWSWLGWESLGGLCFLAPVVLFSWLFRHRARRWWLLSAVLAVVWIVQALVVAMPMLG